MLVYANHLSFQGAGAEQAVFKGIGAWLKEQLGFGLHPDQLRQEGEFNGYRGDVRSWLRVYATNQEEPELYAWVLKHPDKVRGRQWITELGLKSYGGTLELSCILKTDEHSTLVASPVMPSRPRVIGYVVNNVEHANDAEFAVSVPGVTIKTVGQDRDSYRALQAEIERRDRVGPLVFVSPTRDGDYLFNVVDLQQKLIGLAQVVQISRDFNSYEMAEVVGQAQSAWSGAVNVLYVPTATGQVRGRLFLADAITGWGDQQERTSQVLAWVTNNTNIPRLRNHIRPEGVVQLALRRRMQAARAKSEHMDAGQLRQELEAAAKQAAEQTKYFDELVDENSQLEGSVSAFKEELEDARDKLAKKDYAIHSLKEQLSRAGSGRSDGIDASVLVDMALRSDPPLPQECLDLVEDAYRDSCTVLASARSSAEEMDGFIYGRELLGLLRRLVTEYRARLMAGGDNQARAVFGKNEYAAKESETVMANKAMRRQRTFSYEGEDIEMFRHLKIGVDDDVTRTIRVHFHWDSEKAKIVIGYCGKHLSVSSH